MSKTKTNISVKDNTGARVEASVIVGPAAGYVSGDILDANATANLINEVAGDIPEDIAELIEDLSTQVESIYDDVETAKDDIADIQSVLNLDQEQVTTAIDTFQEIVAFLDNIDNDETLEGIVNSIMTAISACITSPSGTIATENIVNEADLDLSTLSNNSITFVV